MSDGRDGAQRLCHSQIHFFSKNQFITLGRDLDFIAPPSRTLRRDKPGLNWTRSFPFARPGGLRPAKRDKFLSRLPKPLKSPSSRRRENVEWRVAVSTSQRMAALSISPQANFLAQPMQRAWHDLVLVVHLPAAHTGGIDPASVIRLQNFVPRGTKFCHVGFAPSRLCCSSVVKLSALLRIISSQKPIHHLLP